MKRLAIFMVLLCMPGLFFALPGCGVSKEEQERLVSELGKIKAELQDARAELTRADSELKQTRAALAKITEDLKNENARCFQMEKSFNEKHNALIISVELLKKEKRKLASKALAARNEAVYLRDKMDELIHGLRKMTEELNLVKRANKALRDEMDVLTKQKDQLKEIPGQ